MIGLICGGPHECQALRYKIFAIYVSICFCVAILHQTELWTSRRMAYRRQFLSAQPKIATAAVASPSSRDMWGSRKRSSWLTEQKLNRARLIAEETCKRIRRIACAERPQYGYHSSRLLTYDEYEGIFWAKEAPQCLGLRRGRHSVSIAPGARPNVEGMLTGSAHKRWGSDEGIGV